MAEKSLERQDVSQQDIQEETPEQDVPEQDVSQETPEQDTQEEKLETPEQREGFVKNLINKITGKKEEKESEKDYLPDDFVEVMRQNLKSEDLSDEDIDKEIVKFASDYSDKELVELIPYLTEQETSDSQDNLDKEDGQDDLPKETEQTNSEVKTLRKDVDDLKKILGKVKQDEADQFLVQLGEHANEVFDKASEDFEVFGLTKDLPKFPTGPKKGQFIPISPAFKARSQVYDVYVNFVNSGQDMDTAMKNALAWYKGLNMEKNVKRDVIKSLERNKKRLSPKRKDKEFVESYDSEDDKNADTVRKIARKVGVRMD